MASPDAADAAGIGTIDRRFVLAGGVRIRLLDDEAIVFNPCSWETHLLNPAAALVLEMAAAGPCTEESIRGVLAEVLSEDQRRRSGEHAHKLLNELTGLRLLVEQTAATDARC